MGKIKLINQRIRSKNETYEWHSTKYQNYGFEKRIFC